MPKIFYFLICMVIFSSQRPNDVPENFANNSDVGRMLNDTWSPYHIGLTCDGEVT